MKALKRLLWWLIAGSEGGYNRALIIHALNDRPYNANQLAKELKLDYKTIRHHIDVLSKNNLITFTGTKYARMYFVSPLLEDNFALFEEIWNEIGKKKIKDEKGSDNDE
jgi:DNA-binding MarR family transcriptional regulator